MASAFTHLLVGGALAGLGPPPRLRLAVVLALLTVLPDLDVVGFRLGIPYAHPLGHRGLTHSAFFAALCGLATPGLAGHRAGLGSPSWWRVAGLGFGATLSHGLLDALTNGGLGVGFLLPFSTERYFLPWRPLAVSPLSVGAFFSGAGLRILASEILWVWLPLGALVGVCIAARRRGRTGRSPSGTLGNGRDAADPPGSGGLEP